MFNPQIISATVIDYLASRKKCIKNKRNTFFIDLHKKFFN